MNWLLLKPINFQSLLVVVAIVAVLAIVFALLIVLVSKLCYVKTDERVDAVSSNLAGANCGGCGYAGCGDYAKALVEGKTTLGCCGATSNEAKQEIAKILNIPFDATEKKLAIIHCAGGKNSLDKFNYVGNEGCVARSLLLGGGKVCSSACLGGGTCANVCTNNAIVVKDDVAIVDRSACGGCGACVNACPKSLVKLIPISAKVYVACASNCKGKEVMGACKVGCIGCGLCAKNCPQGAIEMVDNVAVIDYSKCSGCKVCVAKCPRKCIKEL